MLHRHDRPGPARGRRQWFCHAPAIPTRENGPSVALQLAFPQAGARLPLSPRRDSLPGALPGFFCASKNGWSRPPDEALVRMLAPAASKPHAGWLEPRTRPRQSDFQPLRGDAQGGRDMSSVSIPRRPPYNPHNECHRDGSFPQGLSTDMPPHLRQPRSLRRINAIR